MGGSKGKRYIYTCGWFTLLYGRNQHNIVKQFSSVAQSCPTLCHPMNRSTPGLPDHHQLPEFTQTHVNWVGMPSSHLILCRPLLLLPPIPPSIRVFSNESILHMRWPKYWSLSLSISPSNEHPGLISLQSKGLSRVFSNTSLKASILWCSAFFTVQLSHPCDHWKNHSLD